MSRNELVPWRIAGLYFESCNCDAICPCRRIGGVLGGRSTYGVCFGALSWLVEHGSAGDVQLHGLAAVLTYDYDDDEPGSPWRLNLHVDERGDERQREALAEILLGRLGGEHVLTLPWIRKPSELLALRVSRIEIEHDDRRHAVRIGSSVAFDAERPVETSELVSCIVPGHHCPGTELYADELAVHDEPFEWQLSGNCAFSSRFDYSS
jgi:hypothetical protein